MGCFGAACGALIGVNDIYFDPGHSADGGADAGSELEAEPQRDATDKDSGCDTFSGVHHPISPGVRERGVSW